MNSAPSAVTTDQRTRLFFWLAWGAILVFLYAQSGAWRLLNSPPAGNHAWAQSDRASMAWTYFHDGNPFWYPATQSIGHDPSGIDTGEFPLLPYLVSLEYRLFGFHDFLFRYTTFLISLAGFWLAARISRTLVSDPWLALVVSTAWIVSPNLLYYSVGYLPDPVAITAFLAGIWCWIHPIRQRPWPGIAAFSLSILLKLNFLILYIAWVIAQATAQRSWQPLKRVQTSIPIFAGLAWMGWGWYLKSVYHGHIFTTSPRIPASMQAFGGHISSFLGEHLSFIFPPLLALAWVAIVGWQGMTGWKHRNPYGLAAMLALFGWFAFFWAMGHLSPHHHYYHLVLAPICFIASLAISGNEAAYQQKIRPIAAVTMALLLAWAAFFLPETIRKTAFHIDGIHAGWYSAHAFLQEKRIPEEDWVFTYEDASPNISLYLIQQKGINGTAAYPAWYLEACLRKCDVALVTDPGLFRDPPFDSIRGTYLGESGGLHLYRLRH